MGTGIMLSEVNFNCKMRACVCRCLVDGVVTGSGSKFMPRKAENVLQFQLEAFRFQNAESGLVSTF